MQLLYQLVVVVHLIGMASIVGSYLAVVKTPRVTTAMLHGAVAQLITGVALVAMLETGTQGDVVINHLKISIKLTIAMIVTALVFIGGRSDSHLVQSRCATSAAALATINVVVAAMWQ